MKIIHSISTDQVYIALKEIGHGEAAVQHPVLDEHLRATVVLDINAEGRLIGIDVIGARRGLPPELLEEADALDTGE